MGHADISTTMVYVHHVPQHDAAERLGRVVAGSVDYLSAGSVDYLSADATLSGGLTPFPPDSEEQNHASHGGEENADQS